MLYADGAEIKEADIHCTEMLSRLCNNVLPSYSLDNMGKKIGFEKSDVVKKYISKHKLQTKEDGKTKPHYNLVPLELIQLYGERDGAVTYALGKYCLNRISKISAEQRSLGLPDIRRILNNEVKLTKVLFKMECTGVKLDLDYCKEAYESEVSIYNEAEAKFEALTGLEFSDSRTVFVKAFEKLNLPYGKTEKGNASFKDDNLPDNSLGNIIRDRRSAFKRAGTYYKNFLELADKDGVIHCNFRQAGTSTGRMSCSEPNLQNVPKRGEDNFTNKVRRAFIPRENHTFVMVDFDQMEYRLLMDLAGEDKLIKRILDEGLDVHTATADDVGVERFHAKTLNFAIIYGSGDEKLSGMLKVDVPTAKSFRGKYFQNLQKVQNFVYRLKRTAKTRGSVTNLYGRLLQAPKGTDYKIPNHYIQGTCGDIVKEAMIQ